MAEPQRDLMRVIFAVLFVGSLIGISFWILKPFLGAAIWAATIVVATWPLMLSAQERMWGKRGLAVAAMTLLLLCVLILPLWLAIDTIVTNVDPIAAWVKSLSTFTVPAPPAWLGALPLVEGFGRDYELPAAGAYAETCAALGSIFWNKMP